ncbi:hypothetical protein DFH09DRAFT_1087140 [Mycena vulgaris]|nr:hypothetical protein DFH09DRAFT_1087140 [Mycena vulgaris]
MCSKVCKKRTATAQSEAAQDREQRGGARAASTRRVQESPALPILRCQSKPDHPTLTPLLRQRAALAWSPGWRSLMRPLVITSLLPYFVFVDSSTCNASGRPLNAKTVAAEPRALHRHRRPAVNVSEANALDQLPRCWPRRVFRGVRGQAHFSDARLVTIRSRAPALTSPIGMSKPAKTTTNSLSQSIVDTERSERGQNPERRAAGSSGAGARAGWKLVDGAGAGRERERERERERAGRV